MSLGRYAVLVLGVALATLGLAWPLGLGGLGAPARAAVGFGVTLALVNTIAAHALLRWSASRSNTQFLKAVLGGMLGRMVVLLAALVAGILALRLPRLPLAVSLLAYFAAFLAVELTLAHRQLGAAAGLAR